MADERHRCVPRMDDGALPRTLYERLHGNRLGSVAQALWLGVLCVVGCGEPPVFEPGFQSLQSAIVYGRDDRQEVRQYHDTTLVQLATDTVGALIPAEYLLPDGSDAFIVDGPTLGERLDLCDEEPWKEQPALALCTAVLVKEDLIVTAAHCVREPLDAMVFVLGYSLDDGFPRMESHQVYRLAVVLRDRDDTSTDFGSDVAVVRLQHSAFSAGVSLPPMPPRLEIGDPVIVVGTSEGLPLKIEDGGRVFDATALTYFEVTSDTFIRGSGSLVLSPAGEMLGMLVGGVQDYAWNAAAGCVSRVRLDEPTSRGEVVVRAEVLSDTVRTIARSVNRAGSSTGCLITVAPSPIPTLAWLLMALAAARLAARSATRRRDAARWRRRGSVRETP